MVITKFVNKIRILVLLVKREMDKWTVYTEITIKLKNKRPAKVKPDVCNVQHMLTH